MGLAQTGHRQRLQIAGLRIIRLDFDRFSSPLEQSEHIAAPKCIVELPMEVVIGALHQVGLAVSHESANDSLLWSVRDELIDYAGVR